MFTGLVQSTGSVTTLRPTAFGVRLTISAPTWDYRPKHGDSIAVSGCCLTYAPAEGDPPGSLGFDVIAETLRKTKLGALREGSRVNLESCLTPSSPIGGHFVQGHVDGQGRVTDVVSGGEHHVRVGVDRPMMRYMTPTGSITVDGVSLTLAAVDHANSTFEVALIPTTLELTTLADLKVGDAVNLEADVLVKAVVNYLEHFGPPPR